MNKLKALLESLLLFGVMFLVYEIMYYGYMYIIRYGMTVGWTWINRSGYDLFNLDRASLFYLKDHPVEYTLISWFVIILMMIMALVLNKGQGLSYMYIRWLSVSDFLVSILSGIGLVFVINGLLGFAADILETEWMYIPNTLYESYDLVYLLITVGVIAPICEELFFRGMMMGRLAKAFGPGLTVFLTSVLFSASHLNLSQSVFVFPVGLFAGLLVYRTGVVFAGIWLHVTYNVVNIYLAKMDFFQYNSVQLLVLIVFGTVLLYFGQNQLTDYKAKEE